MIHSLIPMYSFRLRRYALYNRSVPGHGMLNNLRTMSILFEKHCGTAILTGMGSIGTMEIYEACAAFGPKY
jgi:hypothetical protein